MKTLRPPALLVLAVLAGHLLLGREVQRIHDGWVHDGAARPPPRMQVEFVREMVMQPAAPVRAAPRKRGTPESAAVAPAASAPASAPEIAPDTGPVTEALPEPAEPVVGAASSPAEAIPPAAAASAAPGDEPGPEWPLSTRLTYALTGTFRGGPIHGQAQVEWLRKGRDYQVHLDVSAGPSFQPFLTRRISSHGQLTADGIAPQRYDEEEKRIFRDPWRVSVFFLGAEVQLAHGVRQPLPRGAQDSASQFVQLTWLFLTGREPLQVGHRVEFPLVLARRQYAWQYELMGEVMLDTPMGPVASWHLKPTQPTVGGDLAAEVWLAPALQYLPVRLLIRQNADTVIDLMLKRAPLQAAPESTDDTSRKPSP